MLGHQLLISLSQHHDVKVTLRNNLDDYQCYQLFNRDNSFSNVDVTQPNHLPIALYDFRPNLVINAVGIVKQLKLAKEFIPSIETNALFPHRLAGLCQKINARMIHISTDCVFSGKKGQYTEDDIVDAEDLYGKTKYLGEVHNHSHCLTIRCSIIGLEFARKTSLIEWFLAQTTPIKGFRRAIYSGITTQEMGRLIQHILVAHPNLSGMFHVASTAISKYDLLKIFQSNLNHHKIHIEPDDSFHSDLSLSGQRFHQITGYSVPTWETMLAELAEHVNKRELTDDLRK